MQRNDARDWARSLRGLTKSERIIIRELAEYAHEGTNVVWPSQEKLSLDTEIPLRTVQRSLANMESRGLLSRTKGNQHQGTMFTLHLDTDGLKVNPPFQSEPAKVNTPLVTGSQKRTRHFEQVNPPKRTSEPAILNTAIKERTVRTVKEPLAAAATREETFIGNLVSAFENNIGLASPFILEDMTKLDNEFHPPPSWATDAVKEAALHNGRSWNYIKAILTRWSTQGRQNGHKPKDTDNAVHENIRLARENSARRRERDATEGDEWNQHLSPP